jgi:hypothetical protein
MQMVKSAGTEDTLRATPLHYNTSLCIDGISEQGAEKDMWIEVG